MWTISGLSFPDELSMTTIRSVAFASVLAVLAACSSKVTGDEPGIKAPMGDKAAKPEAAAAAAPAAVAAAPAAVAAVAAAAKQGVPAVATPKAAAGAAAPAAGGSPAAASASVGVPVTGLKSLENVFRVGDRVLSGAAPENEQAFEELQALGVKTILTVDGSAPDVKQAEAHGMRYVHIPVTYAEVTPEQQLEIAKAVRDLPGPIYMHCHHGKHRGPAAVASAEVLLGTMTPEEGVAFMKLAGTAANYTGLYACVAGAKPADKAAIDGVPSDFPSVAKPAGLVAAMVNVDVAFDHLGAIRAASWAVPTEHPDLVPAAEAGQLADNLRFGSQSEEARDLGDGFGEKLAAALAQASALEQKLLSSASKEELEANYKSLQSSCKSCHSEYRDAPR